MYGVIVPKLVKPNLGNTYARATKPFGTLEVRMTNDDDYLSL